MVELWPIFPIHSALPRNGNLLQLFSYLLQLRTRLARCGELGEIYTTIEQAFDYAMTYAVCSM